MPKDVRAVVDALFDIADARLVWRRGLKHVGGPHYRLAGKTSPISIGEDECRLFGTLIEHFRPEHCFIIGNAFGFSSAYVALVMAAHGGRGVVTLDSQAEGDGAKCAAVALQVAERLGLALLDNKKGCSPDGIPAAVEVAVHQLIFIDGLHAHPQVTRDFEGILPYSDQQSIFVWHDFWMRGIPQCIDAARRQGFRCLWVPTSCEMVIATRDATVFAQLEELFPSGQEDRSNPTRWQWLWTTLSGSLHFAFEIVTGAARRRP